MDHMNVLPVSDNSGMSAGSGALGAFAGALFGSWFGDGFGGRRGVDGGVVAPVTSAIDTSIMLDSINSVNSSVLGVGSAVTSGNAAINANISNAAANLYTGLNNTMTTGMMASQAGFNGIQSTLCQGFSGVNQSVYQAGVDTRFAIADLARSQAECCCEVKGVVAAEGAATRQLIQNNMITELQTALCDAKSANAALTSKVFLQESQAAQTASIVNTILAHIPKA